MAVNPRAPQGKLDIGPQEYFVLSRIDGEVDVGTVIDAAGLPPSETEKALEKLIAVGAVVAKGGGGRTTAKRGTPAAAGRKKPSSSRDAAADRRRKLLEAGFGPARKPPSKRKTRPLRGADEEGSGEGSGSESSSPEEGEDEAPPAMPQVADDDPRLSKGLEVPLPDQRILWALVDRLGDLSPYELLGIHPTHDSNAIRNAFRQASRRYHPDAYHGRELGPLAGVLSQLFAAATEANRALADESIRTPLVDEYVTTRDTTRAVARERRERMEAARKAAEEIRERQEAEEAAARRKARAVQRAQQQRGRMAGRIAAQLNQHLAEASAAEEAGNLAAASNHYRLALRLDPANDDVKANWERTRKTARAERAKQAFSRAMAYLDVGQGPEALALLLEAADADPSPKHLANAADAIASTDAARARELAIAALDALSRPDAELPGDAEVGEYRLMIARAFLAAGQTVSAKQQAQLAQRARPSDPNVRALLNSIKVT